MTRSIIVVGIIGLIIGGIVLSNNKVTYEVVQPPQAEPIVQPDWATDEEAVEAAKAVIHRKALEADLNAVEGKIEALRATYEAELATLTQKQEELQKELGTY